MVKKSMAGRPVTSHSSKQHRSQNPDAGRGAGKAKKGHGRKMHEKKIAKGAKEFPSASRMPRAGTKPRKGCFPKAFMVSLPLLLIGAYLFIRS